MKIFTPEQFSKRAFGNYKIAEVRNACEKGAILEAQMTKCDKNMNVEVAIGNGIIGVIPFEEFEYSAEGKPTKAVAVLTHVGKTIQFKVLDITKTKTGTVVNCSRKAAMQECYEEYISKLEVGQVINARATFVESYGIFCDIGCGFISLLPIENVCTTRINDPKDSLRGMNNLKVIVKSIEGARITLTHKELLGTWAEESCGFETGNTVTGIVRIVESYGIFIQLTPNLVGLADNYPDVECGDQVTVYIKNIYPDKMKIKLLILSKNEKNDSGIHFDYKLPESGYLRDWVYSPEGSLKVIESHF